MSENKSGKIDWGNADKTHKSNPLNKETLIEQRDALLLKKEVSYLKREVFANSIILMILKTLICLGLLFFSVVQMTESSTANIAGAILASTLSVIIFWRKKT